MGCREPRLQAHLPRGEGVLLPVLPATLRASLLGPSCLEAGPRKTLHQFPPSPILISSCPSATPRSAS